MNQLKDSNSTHWDEISRIASTKIVKLTVLIPVLGYLILFSAWFEENFRIFGEFPTWKVHLLYYGFTAVALGSIIYSIYCPRLVQIYGSATEYISNERKIMFDFKQVELVQNILLLAKKTTPDQSDIFTHEVVDFIATFSPEDFSNEIVLRTAIQRKLSQISDILPFMFAYFELLEQSKKEARYAVYYLFRAGFVLVAIPSVFMFVEIVYHSYIELAKNV